MIEPVPNFRRHMTLTLGAVLHGFTHAYAAMFVPLYLAMKDDLHLSGVRAASLVVTVYGLVYFLLSYFAGKLADRFDRRILLGIGLLGNALAVMAIGLTRRYELILLFGAAAGLFGTLYHPTANSLGPSLYPHNPGKAIGLLGIGSGLGFFVGPQYAGWRFHTAAWHFGSVAQWQKPCIELGAMGIVVGIIFLLLAADAPKDPRHASGLPMGATLRKRVAILAFVLMFRDFAGVAALTLASIYVQRAFGKSVEAAGWMVGLMMLPGVVMNPLGVVISGGRRRLPALTMVLITGACIVATTPLWPAAMIVPVLCTFQGLQLGSYAISDAGTLERVDPMVRGRVVGLFLLIAGTFGALAPWVMGAWTDALGARATNPHAYFAPFAVVALAMLISAYAPKLIAQLGPVTTPPTMAEEITPATMDAAI